MHRALWIPILAAGTTLLISLPRRQAVAADEEPSRFATSREILRSLPLSEEDDAFSFAIFGDRTGGPAAGVRILEAAVREVNVIGPDLVMTVGDLIEGYNQTTPWLRQMEEFRGIMGLLDMPWFPVAGNHDIYWRGEGRPAREHEADYEQHFGPLWYAFEHKGCWFITLFSDEGDPETGRRAFDVPACQKMSPEQFEWLAETLDRTQSARHVFVFLHHPRWLEGGYGRDWSRVHALLRDAGNVTAVFAGHIHNMRYDGVREGIEYFTLATVGGHQRGTVPRAGDLHHYNLVTVRDSGIQVAAFPVGSLIDPRSLTATAKEDCLRLAALAPDLRGVVALEPDFSAHGEVTLHLTHKSAVSVEFEAELLSADPLIQTPSPLHSGILAPGETTPVVWPLHRERGALARLDPLAEVAVRWFYPGTHARIEIPEVRRPLCFLPPRIPATTTTGTDALTLDGSGEYARVESQALGLSGGPFTLEAWCRADAFSERQGFLNNTESSGYGLFLNGGQPAFLVHLGGQYVTAQPANLRLQVGRWHHVAGVYRGDAVLLFVDGELVAETPGRGTVDRNTLPLLIGADVAGDGSGNSWFQGQIDEVRVTEGARYEAPFTPSRHLEADPGTVLLLPFEELVGPYSLDLSGNDAHAVLRGAAMLEACRPDAS